MQQHLENARITASHYAEEAIMRIGYEAELRPIAFRVAVGMLGLAVLVLAVTGAASLRSSLLASDLFAVQSSTTPTPTAQSAPGAAPGDAQYYDVIRVIDGDTIVVAINNQTTTVRLIGIDTPETKDPDQPVQCYGKEATARMQALTANTRVRLAADTTQDSIDDYQRLLRYVYLESGENLALEMIRGGYGEEYTYRTPYAHQAAFQQAEADARAANAGLWSPKTCAKTPSNATSSATPPATTPSSQQPTAQNNCDSNYTPCIPAVSHDLDCDDIRTSVRVIGSDIHNFDRDSDGYGCESYS